MLSGFDYQCQRFFAACGFIFAILTGAGLEGFWAQPPSFGRFRNDRLVGNFGDGQINAYAEKHGRFEHRGTLRAAGHGKLTIDGLWALEFGNSDSNGDPQTLFFTAGPNEEADGLFGTIKPSS